MIRRITDLYRSVSARLVIIILAAGVMVNLLVLFSFGHLRHQSAATYHRILSHYVQTLATAIGDPPDPARAASIAEATGLEILYRSSAVFWSTADSAKAAPPLNRFALRRVGDRTEIGFKRGQILIRHGLAEGDLFFYAPGSEEIERGLHLWMGFVLSGLTLIIAGAYGLIRRILRPLQRLKKGVAAVHAGDLDHRVPEQGAAEFKDLAAAFNEMTARVKDMLQSRQRLLLDVSHELRSPIARMKLCLALMPEDARTASLGEDLREMETMVNSLLEAARLRYKADALEKAAVAIGALVAETIDALGNRLPGVVVRTSTEVHLFADRSKLHTAIRNVVENGLKYSLPQSPPVEVYWEEMAGSLELTVQDHGIGIAAKDQARVFEPFFRVDDSRSRSTGGFGLGLSLARAIVEAHGGTIGVAGTPGKGTRVTMTLPLE